MEVHGSCDPKFQSVRWEFERNFRERGEVGASVCVTVRGETVVDLWGGIARADTQTPWTVAGRQGITGRADDCGRA